MSGNRRVKVGLAREMRKSQTKTEEIMWWLLRKKAMSNYKFRRQYILEGFILDFYCPSAKLGIELDGGVHIKQKDYDKARQRIIEEKGIKLLRFNNSEIYNSPEKVLTIISRALPPAALSTKWRGGTPTKSGWERI
jgi:very-short-patch-repair endonuclease